jgi:hypothetical protein
VDQIQILLVLALLLQALRFINQGAVLELVPLEILSMVEPEYCGHIPPRPMVAEVADQMQPQLAQVALVVAVLAIILDQLLLMELPVLLV